MKFNLDWYKTNTAQHYVLLALINAAHKSCDEGRIPTMLTMCALELWEKMERPPNDDLNEKINTRWDELMEKLSNL